MIAVILSAALPASTRPILVSWPISWTLGWQLYCHPGATVQLSPQLERDLQ